MEKYDLVYHCAHCNRWSEIGVVACQPVKGKVWPLAQVACAWCADECTVGLARDEQLVGTPKQHQGTI